MAESLAGGRYRLRRVIGTGAFATVYAARDERLLVDVAVKILAENHSLDPDIRERFITEGHLLRRIDSRHVVTVYDIGETDRAQPFLVLEYADRGDLAARLGSLRKQGYQPSRDDLVHLATVLDHALDAVHAADVVHRDLSPGNVLIRSAKDGEVNVPCGLVGSDERLLLADLGLSKDLAAASGLTVGAGTSGFAPPEQRGGGRPIDSRADIWAAGALMVWAALGQAPDDGGTWRSDLARAGWPPSLGRVLARTLAPDPDARPSTPRELRDSVVSVLPTTSSTATSEPGESSQRPRRWRRWAVIALVVALAVGGGVGFAAGRLGNDGGNDAGTSVERVAGNRVRVADANGGLRVAVEGPAEIDVGSTGRFDADVAGASSWVWLAPDGQVHLGVRAVEIKADSPGRATIRLAAVSQDGRTVDVGLPFNVRQP